MNPIYLTVSLYNYPLWLTWLHQHSHFLFLSPLHIILIRNLDIILPINISEVWWTFIFNLGSSPILSFSTKFIPTLHSQLQMSINPTNDSLINYPDQSVLTSLKMRKNKNACLKHIIIHAILKMCYYKTTFTTKTLLKETKLGRLSDKKKNAEGCNSVNYKVKHLNSHYAEIYKELCK